MSYAFGEFELDPASYELRSRGRSVALQPKVLELLSYLIENRDRVVGKHELLSTLWPGVHVSESSLAWCVSQARKALAQKRSERAPIETVHGRGYRFATDVTATGIPAASRSGPTSRPGSGSQPSPSSGAGSTSRLGPSPGPSPRPNPLPRSPPLAGSHPDSSARALGSPFVGRHRVMESLRQAWRGVHLHRRGAGYLVVGEAGIGKTRCAEELALEARAVGLSAWIGRCLEADGTPAFWPWIQVLRERLREPADGPARELAESLLTDLVPRAPRASASVDPAFMNGRSGGFWVLDRIVEFLTETAAAAPRLIILDDLQWADGPSLQALELLVPDLQRHAIFLVATLRDTDEPSPACKRSLERLGRHFTSVALTGLPREEVGEYLAAATGQTPSAELVAEVQHKSGGNPLFVQELAQRIVEHAGDAVHDHVEGPSRPLGEVVGARTFLLARLARRDPRILSVLEVASILGESFDLPVLAAVLEVAPESLVSVLDTALRARLLERRPGVGGYAFVHALVRNAVQSGLSEAARCAWHRRAGEVLEPRAAVGEVTRLAFHFYEAMPSGTHLKAARYASTAAQAAARVFAHVDALKHWKNALEALDFDPRALADTDARTGVLVGMAATELHLGLRTESRERLKLAIRLAQENGHPKQLIAAARVLRHSLLSHIDIDPLARGAIESALPMLTDERDRTTSLSLLGAVHVGSPASAKAREASALALALPVAAGGQTRLEALWSRTFSLTGPDDVKELLDVSDEMLRLDASLGRSWWSGEARYVQFCAQSHRGDMPARDHALDELGRLARYCRLPEALWHHDRLKAQIAQQEGAFEAAAQSWKELSERPVLAELGYVKVLHALHRASLAIERGAPSGSSYDLWRLLSSWSPGPRARSLLASSLVEAGRNDEARVHFDDMAARGFASLPRDRSFLATLVTLATVAIALGDRERAAELEAMLAPYATFNVPDLLALSLGSVAHYLGLLAHFSGRVDEASGRFELALARNGEMGLRPRVGRTSLTFARVLGEKRATRARAVELAESAVSIATALEIESLASEAREFRASL